ncbi:MAG: EAL domain-containing protein [Methylobacter sp.]
MGVLSICAADEHAFADQEYKLFEELVNDLAFGLITLKTQVIKKELEKTLLLHNHAEEDVTLVLTIITMAHNFKLKVVAEGVETQEQMDFLTQKNCDEIQG